MELELKKEKLNYCEFRADIAMVHEETAETIVPDYYPDIARILNNDGIASVDSCELLKDKATVAGTARLCVLYLPEGDKMVRSLPIVIPFTVAAENAEWGSCERVIAEATLTYSEVRCINPRKVFSRIELSVTLRGVATVAEEICCGTESDEKLSVAENKVTQSMNCIVSIHNKEFSYVDEISISPGKEAVAELLYHIARVSVQETKRIGAKLVIKGLIHMDILYRNDDGNLCTASEEIRMSQIMEIGDENENAACDVSLCMCESNFSIGGENNSDDRRIISVEFKMKATAVLYETKTFTYVTDIYSTAYEMVPEMHKLRYVKANERFMRRQTVREILEVGTVAKSVLMSNVSCSAVAVSREGDNVVFKTGLVVKVIFLDENDVPSSVERRLEGICNIELPADFSCNANVTCSEEIFAAAGGGGIEVRIPLDFSIIANQMENQLCVYNVKMDMETPKNTSNMPSVVLRNIGESEKLWDIAKHYSTTVSEICAANAIKPDEETVCGRLLLIPKKR